MPPTLGKAGCTWQLLRAVFPALPVGGRVAMLRTFGGHGTYQRCETLILEASERTDAETKPAQYGRCEGNSEAERRAPCDALRSPER
jgi:hypothetical protein